MARATPPPIRDTPHSSANQPGRGCSIAASRSASAGRTRPARQAAANTASCATATPIPSAATRGIHEWAGPKWAGATPWSTRASAIALASGRPASSPRPPATSDTISASAAISRRTCSGVAPSARSTAVSRRRCAIARANVPATTNSATAPAIPAIVPKIATSVMRSVASGSPASADAAWRWSSTSPIRSSPGPGVPTMPTALTSSGCPDRVRAVSGAKNSADCAASAAAATPLTR